MTFRIANVFYKPIEEVFSCEIGDKPGDLKNKKKLYEEGEEMKTLIIYKSIHMGNTKRIAQTMAKVLNADLFEPEEFDINKIGEYDVIGFGSGFYGDRYHQNILNFVDEIPTLVGKRVFLFATAGVINLEGRNIIRPDVEEKGAVIVGEFLCKGFNKNSFLKYFGGMNKGRPNEKDIRNAERFAKKIIEGGTL